MIIPPEKIIDSNEDIDKLLDRLIHKTSPMDFFTKAFPSEKEWKSKKSLYNSKEINEIIDGLTLSLEIGERCIQKISEESTNLRVDQLKILVESAHVSARDARIYVEIMRESVFPEWVVRRARMDVDAIERGCLDFCREYNLELHDAGVQKYANKS